MARVLDHRRRMRHGKALGIVAAGAIIAGGAGAQNAEAVELVRSDADFILDQIKIAEADSATPGVNDLPTLIGSPQLPLGLRSVKVTHNNLGTAAQQDFGAADLAFPRLLSQLTRTTEPSPVGFPPTPAGQPQTYAPPGPGGLLYDSPPRTISNLIADQNATNPAADNARTKTPGSGGVADPTFIPNANNDGVSASYNSWFSCSASSSTTGSTS